MVTDSTVTFLDPSGPHENDSLIWPHPNSFNGPWAVLGSAGHRGTAASRCPAGTAAEIVRVTVRERLPDGSTQWTPRTRTLAERVGVSRETVRRVWAEHGLRPWRTDTFKLSNDPALRQADRLL